MVSMATVVKGKNSSAYFRKLMWTSTPREFHPKATIISLEKISHPVQLFPINRALDPSNRFVTKKKFMIP